ncbi:MAG: ubiquinone biosynthesis regulatory protein kinase UbiB, partial [Thiobacillus sp.]|nr:ubiquinone biosynthesis regulatory protein kinase UbiB [Thiobacillus sp.]
QKTLLNIEGLGRQLDPELDLWKTAKPFLERWMNEQMGWRALMKNLQAEAPKWAVLLPQLPRLAHTYLSRSDDQGTLETRLERIAVQQARNAWLLAVAIGLAVLSLAIILLK